MQKQGKKSKILLAVSNEQIANKLGDLVELSSELVRELIISRGGTAANVRETGHWADRSLNDTAIAAIRRDDSAEKAVKIVKQARRLGQKY